MAKKRTCFAGPTREILAWDQVHSGGKNKKIGKRCERRGGLGREKGGSPSLVLRSACFAYRSFTPFLPFSHCGAWYQAREIPYGPSCPLRWPIRTQPYGPVWDRVNILLNLCLEQSILSQKNDQTVSYMVHLRCCQLSRNQSGLRSSNVNACRSKPS